MRKVAVGAPLRAKPRARRCHLLQAVVLVAPARETCIHEEAEWQLADVPGTMIFPIITTMRRGVVTRSGAASLWHRRDECTASHHVHKESNKTDTGNTPGRLRSGGDELAGFAMTVAGSPRFVLRQLNASLTGRGGAQLCKLTRLINVSQYHGNLMDVLAIART